MAKVQRQARCLSYIASTSRRMTQHVLGGILTLPRSRLPTCDTADSLSALRAGGLRVRVRLRLGVRRKLVARRSSGIALRAQSTGKNDKVSDEVTDKVVASAC